MEFDLYGERTVEIDQVNGIVDSIKNDGVLIEIDGSKSTSLLDLIKNVKDKLSELSNEVDVTIYFVCGRKCAKNDWNLFFDYLQTVENKFKIVVRGYIHFEFFKMFLLFNDRILIDKNCKIIYSHLELHNLMKVLLLKQETFRRFLQRFVDQYNNLPQGYELDLTELYMIGIDIEKF